MTHDHKTDKDKLYKTLMQTDALNYATWCEQVVNELKEVESECYHDYAVDTMLNLRACINTMSLIGPLTDELFNEDCLRRAYNNIEFYNDETWFENVIERYCPNSQLLLDYTPEKTETLSAEDGKPLTQERIDAGEITKTGHLLRLD